MAETNEITNSAHINIIQSLTTQITKEHLEQLVSVNPMQYVVIHEAIDAMSVFQANQLHKLRQVFE